MCCSSSVVAWTLVTPIASEWRRIILTYPRERPESISTCVESTFFDAPLLSTKPSRKYPSGEKDVQCPGLARPPGPLRVSRARPDSTQRRWAGIPRGNLSPGLARESESTDICGPRIREPCSSSSTWPQVPCPDPRPVTILETPQPLGHRRNAKLSLAEASQREHFGVCSNTIPV